MRVAARNEDVLGIEIARDRKPLPQLGDMLGHERNQIETDDRDPPLPILDQEDPAVQRPLHPLTVRRTGHADHRQPRFRCDIASTESHSRQADLLVRSHLFKPTIGNSLMEMAGNGRSSSSIARSGDVCSANQS
jgi:hypothetical protein